MNRLRITLFLFLIAISGCAQDYQAKSELENEIIGTWHHENDPKSKITFSRDGVIKRYFGDELKWISTYEITNNCENEELPEKQFFLKETDENGSSSCSFIEGINYNQNGFFTLVTSMQGKVIVLKKSN